MERKSSLNIKPRSVASALLHNERVFGLSYGVNKDTSVNDHKLYKPRKELLGLLKKIKIDYQKHSYRGRGLPSNATPIREGALNLKAHHTLADVEKMAMKVAKKMGVEILAISVHRDEGKDAENLNYHAHILFNYYNFNTHRTAHHFSKDKIMQQVQDIAAEMLNMERGKSKEETGIKHIPHGQYRHVAKMIEGKVEEAKTPLITKVGELKKQIAALRQDMISTNKVLSESEKLYSKEDYQALNKLKKELKKENLSEVTESYYTLRQAYDQMKEFYLKEKEENGKHRQIRSDEHKRTLDSINEATVALSQTTATDIRRATQTYQAKRTARANTDIIERVAEHVYPAIQKFERSIGEITTDLFIKRIDALEAKVINRAEKTEVTLSTAITVIADHTNLEEQKIVNAISGKIEEEQKIDVVVEKYEGDYTRDDYYFAFQADEKNFQADNFKEPDNIDEFALKKFTDKTIKLIAKSLSKTFAQLSKKLSPEWLELGKSTKKEGKSQKPKAPHK